MKDIDKLKNLLADFGVLWDEEKEESEIRLDIFSGEDIYLFIDKNDDERRRYFKEVQEKVTGYTGFFTRFVFNQDGSFKEMGAWE